MSFSGCKEDHSFVRSVRNWPILVIIELTQRKARWMMSLLYQPVWRLIDQSAAGPDADGRRSFAIDDTLCESIGSGASPCAARLWVYGNTVMLGTQDTRLPHLAAALDVLRRARYRWMVRNSGGLAVVLDEGVLNLSLIFSEREKPLSIDAPFQTMVDFMKQVLKPLAISFQSGEVAHSYCPGRFDLSSRGRKFAGISQRRVRSGVAVQIYVCVAGSGSRRAALIRDFYRCGLQGERTRFRYPDVDPNVTASLAEITGRRLSVAQLTDAIIHTLLDYGRVEVSSLTEREAERFPIYYQRMIHRNERAFADIRPNP